MNQINVNERLHLHVRLHKIRWFIFFNYLQFQQLNIHLGRYIFSLAIFESFHQLLTKNINELEDVYICKM